MIPGYTIRPAALGDAHAALDAMSVQPALAAAQAGSRRISCLAGGRSKRGHRGTDWSVADGLAGAYGSNAIWGSSTNNASESTSVLVGGEK
jgi:hypothetical protein